LPVSERDMSDPTLVAHGRRLVTEAAARGVALRLLGGAAIWLRASEPARAAFGRDYPDLDLVAHRKQSRQLKELLEQDGYDPERIFNATHGAKRLLYHVADGSYHIDVFLDTFQMSHTLDLGSRLEVEELTLPAAELLLTKLQVAQLNRKDATDAVMLLYDHELAAGDGAGRLNVARVAELCAGDWGLYTTVVDNLATVDRLLPELPAEAVAVAPRIADLRLRLEAAPKTRAWKLRAKVGRRVRWYELPEEVSR
jgi:hypothetical protein